MNRPGVILLAAAMAGCVGRTHPGMLSGGEGVGTEPQPAPYDTPAEASGSLAGAPAGQVSDEAFYESRVYPGLKFRYRLYVPAQYQPGHAAALMVFQDGNGTYLNVLKTAQVFDNLIHAGEMPVTIGLFIDPGTPEGVYRSADHREFRSREYDTLGDTYARFLLEEIVPDVVLRAYTITHDPGGWAIAGQSSGGIAAFTVAWQRPDRFRRVLTQNGSFVNIRGGDTYPALIRAAARKPLRVYLLSGTNDLDNQFGSWLDANTAMAAALQERAYAYRFRSGTGGHYPPLQALADYPAALRWLWRGYHVR
jgi:enterochelin esterase-like enzyme